MLLYYLAVLLILVFAFTYMVFNQFTPFFVNSSQKTRFDEVERLQYTFDLVIDQIHASVFNMQSSGCFSTGHLNEQYGNMYDTKHMLLYAKSTNSFLEDIFYVNNDKKLIYTSQTCYTYDAFAQFYEGGNTLLDNEEAVRNAYLQNIRQYWLPEMQSNRSGEGVLTYVYTNRIGTGQASEAYVFQISRSTIDRLIEQYVQLPEYNLVITDLSFNILYDSNPAMNDLVWSALAPQMQESSSRSVYNFSTAGQDYTAYSIPSGVSSIRYTTIISYQALTETLRDMQQHSSLLFMGAVFLCCVLGYWFVRRSYAPIQSLVSLVNPVIPAQEKYALSEFELAERALLRLSAENQELQIDTALMQLLRGCFATIDQLHANTVMLDKFTLDGPLFSVLVLRACREDAQQPLSVSACSEIGRYLRNVLHRRMNVQTLGYPIGDSAYAVVSGSADQLNDLRTLLPAAKADLEQIFEISLTIGVSRPVTVDQCADALSQARELVQRSGVQLSGAISYVSDASDLRSRPSEYPSKMVEAFYHAILSGQEERIMFVLDPLLRTVEETSDHFFAMRLGYDVINAAMRAFRELEYPFEEFQQKYPELLANGQQYSVSQIVDITRTFCCEICQFMAHTDEGSADLAEAEGKIGQILLYIDTHCNEESFSAKMLADQFGMTASNFSHYFKKQIGRTVSEYIALRRFSKAKTLLRTTDLPLQAVAVRCGYVHISTFMRQFKKYENITPMTYRNYYSDGAGKGVESARESEADK